MCVCVCVCVCGCVCVGVCASTEFFKNKKLMPEDINLIRKLAAQGRCELKSCSVHVSTLATVRVHWHQQEVIGLVLVLY